MTEPEVEPAGPAARLVTAAEVAVPVGHLGRVFDETTEHLRASEIEQLKQRLRGWDNHQRASLGRGETRALRAGDVKSTFSLSRSGFEPRGEPSLALPAASDVPALADLDDVVRLAARLTIPEGYDDHRVIVTLFLYRVIVRAGQNYRGFVHRDIELPQAPVGSVIFYPTVRSKNIDGAEFGVHFSTLPVDDLEARDPDFTCAPGDYERAAVVLSYPHNLPHRVQPGFNPHSTTSVTTPGDDVQEFLDPHETTFVKDMAVLTFTQTSAIEDHIP